VLLARMNYDLAQTSQAMQRTISRKALEHGTKHVTLVLQRTTSTRPLTVTVPNALLALMATLQSSFHDAVVFEYTAFADELYQGSASVPIAPGQYGGLTLGSLLKDAGGTGRSVASSRPVKLDPLVSGYGPNPVECTRSAGFEDCTAGHSLLVRIGCASSEFWQGMPWCVLGAKKYVWSNGTSGLWGGVDGQIQPAGVNMSGGVNMDGDWAKGLMPDALAPQRAQLNCLARHYTFFNQILMCAIGVLQSLMSVDPGCMSVDVLKRRYGCLCRRRTRYIMVAEADSPQFGDLVEQAQQSQSNSSNGSVGTVGT